MTRVFDWRDVGLVRRLALQGVCFDSEAGLTHGVRPLQQALLAYLVPGPLPPTWVWRRGPLDDEAVFGQLRHRPGTENASLWYVAPNCATHETGWQAVVDRLVEEAGKRRAKNLLAEVAETGAEFPALRTAGFAVYARQTVWRWPPHALPAAPTGEGPTLRPAVPADAIKVLALYHNLTPRLVQQVESHPTEAQMEHGYVLEMGQEVMAFLDVRPGPLGTWVLPLFHPEADHEAERVLAALGPLLRVPDKPLYVCVRRYQSWLADLMARAGFEAVGSQAVLVKRLAVHLAAPVKLPLAEAQLAKPVVNSSIH